MIAVLGLVLAAGSWAVLLLPRASGLWVRALVVAIVLVTFSTIVFVKEDGGVDAVLGVSVDEVLVGLLAGLAWVAATQVGFRVIARLWPEFVSEMRQIYAFGDDSASGLVWAIVVMAVAEEFLFRGVLQPRIGLAGAALAYGAVQLVLRNRALVLGALLIGIVWGLLLWWREALTASIVAHAVWTAVLTFAWPLPPGGAASSPRTRWIRALS
jgi:membrane protease YdiL (CAAX protease family)